ncbi:MAG: heparan-alpha-glucosaminide N-acetyltransferase domain-containing protein [Myxococcales bacterium]|jgi:uncharacterized membrane protein
MQTPRDAGPGGNHERLCFIDVARAVAIVWMLASHFVTVSLVDSARDLESPVYLAYARLRSYTAPLFLTVSGLVFVYFLCSSGLPVAANPRVRRGLRRAAMLIGVGYLLRVNPRFLLEDFDAGVTYLYQVHILHVVGVGLLSLVLLYALHRSLRRLPLGWLLLVAALSTFAATPVVLALDLAGWPKPLASYLVTDRASFTLFPWLGYMLIGGACGALVHRFGGVRSHGGAPMGRLAVAAVLSGGGLLLHLRATSWVFRAYRACPAEMDCAFMTPTHVWLARAGAIVAFLGLLMALEPLLRRHAPPVLLLAGQQTLFLFALHAVLLYGECTGYGLDDVLGHALSPAAAVFGGVLFAAFHVWLARARRSPSFGRAPWAALRPWQASRTRA